MRNNENSTRDDSTKKTWNSSKQEENCSTKNNDFDSCVCISLSLSLHTFHQPDPAFRACLIAASRTKQNAERPTQRKRKRSWTEFLESSSYDLIHFWVEPARKKQHIIGEEGKIVLCMCKMRFDRKKSNRALLNVASNNNTKKKHLLPHSGNIICEKMRILFISASLHWAKREGKKLHFIVVVSSSRCRLGMRRSRKRRIREEKWKKALHCGIGEASPNSLLCDCSLSRESSLKNCNEEKLEKSF